MDEVVVKPAAEGGMEVFMVKRVSTAVEGNRV
jgi:hypothetical protein